MEEDFSQSEIIHLIDHLYGKVVQIQDTTHSKKHVIWTNVDFPPSLRRHTP